jgi:hypothetical protein
MSCFGPLQGGKPKYGECVYCWDENWARDHHLFFEPRQRMIGPVCGHRLHAPKHVIKPHQQFLLKVEHLIS